MMKKYNYLILLFVLLCPFIVNARREMSAIQASYPEGSVYSEHYTYLAWSCTDNTCRGKQTNAYQCAGFAARVYRDYFGVDSSWANEVTDVSGIYSLAPGDIVRFNEPKKGAPTSVGHSVVIMSVSGGFANVAEANVGQYGTIRWSGRYNIESFRIGFDHISKAWFPYGNPGAAPKIGVPQNVNAEFNGSTKKLNVNWDYVNPASDYKIKVYKKSDALNNNFSSPVAEKNTGTSQIKKDYLNFDKDGEYAVTVKTILDDYWSNETSPIYFSAISPSSITLSGKPTGTIFIGDKFKLTSTISPENANMNRAITWDSSNNNVATVSNGTVTVVGEGSATISVTTANNKTASITINARKKIDVESVSLNATSKELWTGNTFKLNPTITPNNADVTDISWKSSNTKVVTVSSTGLVSAVGRGTATVTASVGGKSATCTFTVKTTGLALEYTKTVDVITTSNYYLKRNLVTNDGSTIEWDKVTFKVDGKEGTYEVSGDYIDFISDYYGETYTVSATYYGVTSSILVKPVQGYTALSFELLSSYNDFSLFQNKKMNVDFYFQQKANYYPITHLYLNQFDMDVKYDKDLVGIFNLSSEYDFVNIYDDGKGTIHVSFDMGDDVFKVDETNLFRITFIGKVNEDNETHVTFENFKYRIATKTNTLRTNDIDYVLNINTKESRPLKNINVKSYPTTMEVGKTYQLETEVIPANTSDDYTIRYDSKTPSIVSVDSNGKVTPLSPGKGTIMVYVNQFNKQINVTVVDNNIYVTDINITNDLTKIYKGTSYTINATISPENQTETDRVIMTSSDSNIISITNGDGYTKWTAKNEGTVTITCKAGKFTKDYTVTVKPPYVSPTGISISLDKTSIALGTTAKASGTITPSNATDKTITWSSNNTSICTIDSNGTITGKKIGTCTIIGRTSNGKSGSKNLTVVSDITSVKLDKTSIKAIKGDSVPTLKATIYPTNSIDKSLSWTSSNTGVVKVDSTGKLTVVATGSATITVKSSNGKSATCDVTVVASTIKVSPTSLNITVGDSATLVGTVTPDYADKSITWSSSNTSVATVSNGKVTGVSAGTCTISATNKYNVKTTVSVTVKAKQVIAVKSVTLDKSNLSISVDDKVKLNATINPSNATNKTITWSSSNNNVAKVVNGEVTGIAPGYATITAKVDGKSATCGVSVVAKRIDVTSIDLDVTSTILKVGENKTINATVNPSNASNKKITWTSSNSNIVSVNNGVITARSIGKATVTAAIGGISSTVDVTVIDSDNASVYYHTHVESIGDQAYVSNGVSAGTSHQSKRLEAIRIYLANTGYSGSIEYRTHVQDYGWMDYVRDGEMSGTSHQSKRLEAIQIRLTGEVSEHYDIYYRVHAQEFGWMNWAKNDEQSGTASYSYRLEAIEIMLLPKGSVPSNDGRVINYNKAFAKKTVTYRTHVQDIGWQDWKADGKMSGTSHQSKRLEAINIKLHNQDYSGSIEYRTHIQDIGWENDWKSNGQDSGTHGQSKRLEAIEIRLTGEMSNHFDVYYRVHAENFGWMGWAKNGERSGTAHYGYRLEGIEIVVVPKGEEPPARTDTKTSAAFVDAK